MVTYAVTLSDLIEKGGAYAGLAAFFGFAVLSVLAFAQAREIRRLRDWAGRAPERALELEERVAQQADATRRVQATPSRRPGEPATAAAQRVKPAAASAGPPAATAVGAATAAGASPAPAGSAPEAEPAPEQPEGTPAEHEVATATDEAEDRPAEGEQETKAVPAAPAAATSAATAVVPAVKPANGAGAPPKLPPRATKSPPASPPRRPAPAAKPLRATQPPSRRPAPKPAPANGGGGRRRGVVAAAAGAGLLLIVIGLVAIFTGGDSGDSGTSAATPEPQGTATAAPTSTTGGDSDGTPPTRAETRVAVLNGTTVAGLAGQIDTALTQAGYTEAQTPTNYTDQARSASVVFYDGSEYRSQAVQAGKLLDISDVQPISAAPQASQLAPDGNLVVVVGADQTP